MIIKNKIQCAIMCGDWYDITHICKEDKTGYALYFLANFTIEQNEKIKHIKKFLED